MLHTFTLYGIIETFFLYDVIHLDDYKNNKTIGSFKGYTLTLHLTTFVGDAVI